MLQVLLGGFILGATSSLHCVGMCGPLALAVPTSSRNKLDLIIYVCLYHLGRVFTYSLMGAILGITARGLFLSGFQQWLSISMGLLVFSFSLYGIISGRSFRTLGVLARAQRRLAPIMSRLLSTPSPLSHFLLGACNGLLPCGMVYLAIAGALSLDGAAKSVMFMVFFGVGTLPAMISLSFFGIKFKIETRVIFKQVSPYLMLIVGILILFRGLNLGIPFLSPTLITAPSTAISCHQS